VSTDWATVANIATAGGTLVLAVATFGATRSANRTAKLTEKALQLGLEPLLTTARPEDPPERVGFRNDELFVVRGGSAAVEVQDGNVYFAIPVRNVGNGIAVLQSWTVITGEIHAGDDYGEIDDYRQLSRDLYIPSGGNGFWQGAIREADDPQRVDVERAIRDGGFVIDVFYQDQFGGHPAVSRFRLSHLDDGEWFCSIVRHFRVQHS
jgi:hypothetical protein